MLVLILGLALFIGPHLFTRARETRGRAIARLGEGPYKGLHALVSVAGVALMVLGWRHAPYVELWAPPVWTRHLAMALMAPAFVLLIAAYLPGHIRARTRHPMLAALKLWATAHLLANGDLASVILFGALLAYGVAARILLKRRERIEGAPRRAASWQNDVVAVVIGTVAYLLFGTFLHPILIGVPAFPL